MVVRWEYSTVNNNNNSLGHSYNVRNLKNEGTITTTTAAATTTATTTTTTTTAAAANPFNTAAAAERTIDPFYKIILIVDDDTDTTFTLKSGLESNYNAEKTKFDVYTYDNPLVALSDFRPNFYDLLLTDINMPSMNGFELAEKILELDINVRVGFMSTGEVNHEAIRELYPNRAIGFFIQRPVTMDYLYKTLLAELG